MDRKQEVTSGLNDLLTRNYDAEKGYREAAASVNDARLRKWLFDNSERRQKFIAELDGTIKQYGGDPDEGTSFLADLHHAWLDFKSDFLQNDAVTVLEECRRGEERAIEDYNKVLNSTTFPADITGMLNRHKQEIRHAIAGINSLIPAFDEK